MKVLYKIVSGSHLYGLETQHSDSDYVGVFLPDSFSELISPFCNITEIDESAQNKDASGKNTINAVDCKYYRLDKYVKLLAEANPNILETLYAPKDKILCVHPYFDENILSNKDKFLSKRIINRFVGYASSQEKKAYTKTQEHINLYELQDSLKGLPGVVLKTSIKELIKDPVYWEMMSRTGAKTDGELLIVGNLNFPLNAAVQTLYETISNRLAKSSHRLQGVVQHKYDPKFMSHIIRLLDEGAQLLENACIHFPFTADVHNAIMSIKTGKMKLQDIPAVINEYKERIYELESKTSLPEKPDLDVIERIYTDLIYACYCVPGFDDKPQSPVSKNSTVAWHGKMPAHTKSI